MTVERYTSGDKMKRMAQTGLLAGLILVLAPFHVGCDLAPRAMPTGSDENFERVKKILAGGNPGAGEVGRWNEGEEDRFARLIAEAESLRPNAPETLQLRQEFQQLLAAWRERKTRRQPPGDLPETYVDSVGITMKLIRAGKFLMGLREGHSRGRPQREVTIGKPFYMAVHEITQAQWRAVMGTAPWHGKPWAQESPDIAASYISWSDATEFCGELSAKTGLSVRLPTMVEWEYACRAGSKTRFCFGDDASKLGDYAWYGGNTQDVGRQYAHPVGRKNRNGWGLYDMHGNVWEWCHYSSASVRLRPSSGSYGVLRGGSWYDDPQLCRSASLIMVKGDALIGYYGFRVVVPVVGRGLPG